MKPSQPAAEDLEEGELSAPIEADDGFWVIRLERRDAEGTFTDEQLNEMVESRYTDLLAEARASTEIERNLSSDDIDWAFERVG